MLHNQKLNHIFIYIYIKFFYIYICTEISNAVTLGFVLDSYEILNDAFNLIMEDFNKYANETGLDITLEIFRITNIKGEDGYNDYDSALTFMTRKNNKYDLFVYDTNYIKIYSPYLLDLNKHLPKEHLDMYSSENNKKVTIYNDKRVGLV